MSNAGYGLKRRCIEGTNLLPLIAHVCYFLGQYIVFMMAFSKAFSPCVPSIRVIERKTRLLLRCLFKRDCIFCINLSSFSNSKSVKRVLVARPVVIYIPSGFGAGSGIIFLVVVVETYSAGLLIINSCF